MRTFVAFLRGINVSGQRKIKMTDLRNVLCLKGFSEVQTYIQSGNIVLKSDLKADEVEQNISEIILDEFTFEVPVKALSVSELKKTIDQNPFTKNKNIDNSRLYFTFLSDLPLEELINKMEAIDTGNDEFRIIDKIVYLHCPVSYGKSKLTNNYIETKLKVQATTRNWKTTLKMLELSRN